MMHDTPAGNAPADAFPAGVSCIMPGTVAAPLGDGTFCDLFASLRPTNHVSVYAAASFWWTLGGEEFQPTGFCCRRMPDPALQAGMLTGRFMEAVA
jgi:type VI secretion system protein ImpM